ncbi:MAG: enoyl-CoA hydratase/isomerase family protein [Acidimicrobiia bacterium]|nr:enoyl-CoA hydratase/isomerase family protein [Acidimicrobiia bacterium]
MSLAEYAVEGAVARITLNRPPVNALNAELIADIDAAIAEAEDDAIRAVVITGNKHFAAGADINRFVDAFDSDHTEPQASGLATVVRRLELLDKPTIAAIPGYALGGGLELAMGADFRYLADDARVGQPEIMLGMIPGAGGTQRLPRLIGYQAAKSLNMSGRHVAADEAMALGLADMVVPADDLLTVAMEDATRWASGPTKAYAAVKRAMGEGYGRPLDDALAAERDAFDGVFATADARTGVLAFVAKEQPEFTGQ